MAFAADLAQEENAMLGNQRGANTVNYGLNHCCTAPEPASGPTYGPFASGHRRLSVRRLMSWSILQSTGPNQNTHNHRTIRVRRDSRGAAPIRFRRPANR